MISNQVDQKPVAVFASISDIEKYFKKRPNRLIAYIDTGVAKRVSVLAVHISQLATMVGIPLKYNGKVYDNLPEIFISPEKFDNIGAIISAGNKMFPGPLIPLTATP